MAAAGNGLFVAVVVVVVLLAAATVTGGGGVLLTTDMITGENVLSLLFAAALTRKEGLKPTLLIEWPSAWPPTPFGLVASLFEEKRREAALTGFSWFVSILHTFPCFSVGWIGLIGKCCEAYFVAFRLNGV